MDANFYNYTYKSLEKNESRKLYINLFLFNREHLNNIFKTFSYI